MSEPPDRPARGAAAPGPSVGPPRLDPDGRSGVEVKIGVIHAGRELTLDTNQSAEAIHKAVVDALTGDGGVFELSDERGRSVHVPAEKLAYVEIVGEPSRRVGFGTRGGSG